MNSNFIKIKDNPSLENMSEIIPNIIYSSETGTELSMELILPWWDREKRPEKKFPLVVFVQGSAWTSPNPWYEIPQLSQISKMGYAVATLTHRNCLFNNPFPAFLEDIKTGIRFLRKHSYEYNINEDDIGIYGTSSGGNMSLLVAMTIGDERYTTNEHSGYSDKVNYAISCFPPTDLLELYENKTTNSDIRNIINMLADGKAGSCKEILKDMSPLHIFDQDKDYPPILIAHGEKDDLIPYAQGFDMYKKLEYAEKNVTFISVENAPHEGSFWSSEINCLISDFIKKYTL